MHEFNPRHVDNYCSGEHEKTWSLCAPGGNVEIPPGKFTPVGLVEHHLGPQKTHPEVWKVLVLRKPLEYNGTYELYKYIWHILAM